MKGREEQSSGFISLGGSATCQLEKLGTGLIRSVLQGEYGHKEAHRYIDERNQFLSTLGMNPVQTVEIRLLTHLFRPRPGTRPVLCGRNISIREQTIHPSNLILPMRRISPEHLYSQKKTPVLHIVKTSQEAEALAVRLLFEKKVYSPESRESGIITFEKGSYSERYIPLLPGMIFSIIQGPLGERELRERFLHEAELLGAYEWNNETHYRIILWTTDSSLEVRELRLFINETFKLNNLFPFQSLVMIPENPNISKLLQSSLKMFPLEAALVNTLPEAVDRILYTHDILPELASAENSEEDNLQDEQTLNLTKTEIGELKNFLMIAHARESSIISDHVDSIPPEHPLREVYRAFSGYVTQIEEFRRSEQSRGLLVKQDARKYKLLYSMATDWPVLDPSSGQSMDFLLNLLLNSFELSTAAKLTISKPYQDRSFTFSQAVKRSDLDDTLTGTILPLPLGMFMTNREISVFTPDLILNEAALRDGSLKPWLRAFLLKRKLTSAALFHYGIINGMDTFIYLERDREAADQPFSMFDPLVREVYEILRRRKEKPTLGSIQEESHPFDMEEITIEYGGDKIFFLKLLEGFIDEIPERINTLKTLIPDEPTEQTREELRAYLHKIKGAAANLFCEDLRTAAEDFENAVKANAPASWDRCLNKLVIELKRVENYYKTIT